ncbi:hypothetical protein [Methanolobus sp. WCC5]|uniref:hypothetical protein n=1 Tax=Methanolobus sp. WCC5 TaxID=3125785 RepID=UPI003245B6F8
MPLMSIIGCTEFEKEIVKLLAEDVMIDKLLIVDESGSPELVSDLEQRGMKPELLFPEKLPPGLKKSKGFNVLVTLQDVNVYKSSQHLKKETYEKIKFYGLVSNGVLMFYGSCQGIFEDALLDFRNSNFFLELLSSEKAKYLEGIESCSGKPADKDGHPASPLEEYKDCYNRLKELILSSNAN